MHRTYKAALSNRFNSKETTLEGFPPVSLAERENSQEIHKIFHLAVEFTERNLRYKRVGGKEYHKRMIQCASTTNETSL
jgi:hypothetical protein